MKRITRDNFRQSIFAAIDEWKWQTGRAFDFVGFLAKHDEVHSSTDLVEAITAEAIEAKNSRERT